jgi:hypothetical protein
VTNSWYSDTDGGGVTHVHRTSDNLEIGSFEARGLGGFWVVARSPVKPFCLVTEVIDKAAALLTILSRWNLQ